MIGVRRTPCSEISRVIICSDKRTRNGQKHSPRTSVSFSDQLRQSYTRANVRPAPASSTLYQETSPIIMHALMYRVLSLLLYFIFLSQAICTSDLSGRHCRCRPSDACWPSVREWNALNRTVNGHLLRLRPVGSVCHGAKYDENACEAVKLGSESALWRISQPDSILIDFDLTLSVSFRDLQETRLALINTLGALVANNWETSAQTEPASSAPPEQMPATKAESRTTP
jgi:hypothetical protein